MKSKRNDAGEWWIVETPEGVDNMGPYDSKRECDEHRAGVQRWLDARDEEERAEKAKAAKKADREAKRAKK